MQRRQALFWKGRLPMKSRPTPYIYIAFLRIFYRGRSAAAPESSFSHRGLHGQWKRSHNESFIWIHWPHNIPLWGILFWQRRAQTSDPGALALLRWTSLHSGGKGKSFHRQQGWSLPGGNGTVFSAQMCTRHGGLRAVRAGALLCGEIWSGNAYVRQDRGVQSADFSERDSDFRLSLLFFQRTDQGHGTTLFVWRDRKGIS